ncbi:hypothetical protein ACQKP5_27995 [Pseudomonas vancouverensis]|uniref:hypothetical protein n=1 Tax=Pseudomonas vancouverensis TaxID=95300 RepID=UPI003D069831
MHWLESDGCCKAIVIETSVFLVVWRCLAFRLEARFSPRQDPHPGRGLLQVTSVRRFATFSETKKYRQETLLSKVESEPSVIKQLFVA